MSAHTLSLLDTIRDHKRALLESDWKQAERKGRPAEVPFPIEGVDCECGGSFDEYDRCDSCDAGHSDCDLNECERCMDRAIDRAEMYADMARDEEMGL